MRLIQSAAIMAPSVDQAVAEDLLKHRQIALNAGRKLARCKPGEEIVISGISGAFPESENVRVFGENLFSKKEMSSDDELRWNRGNPYVCQRIGKLKDVNKFDAAFFGVHLKQAETMDPMSRILLEKAYEAVVDAGYNPKQMKGSKTGVFIGSVFSETERLWYINNIPEHGFGLTGCTRVTLANRISYWMGLDGPSYVVDSACSSSLSALSCAYRALRNDECDSALVGGCNLCLELSVSLQFARVGALSRDGRCKSFDKNPNGFCRSESIVVIFLEKMKNSRRVYCRLMHAKTNCDGYKKEGITFPSSQSQQQLLEEFYRECEVEPKTVRFLSAHGTGTKVGDPVELRAIENVFCPGRTEPLMVNSVKSNMGHSEPASGLCSLAAVILSYEHGLIPPNINLTTLRSDIESFQTGKMIVMTEPTPWDAGLAGVNNYGFGGANGHILLKPNPKLKINGSFPEDDLPRLVVTSGRTREAVDVILNDCESRSIDVEFIRLLQAIHYDDIPGHPYRGYTILKKDQTQPDRHIENFSGENRSLWFIFGGTGSQWTSMGKSLMKLPAFAQSINKSHQVLKSEGVDLLRIISSEDPKTFDNVLNSFIGIIAIQIALVDVLNMLNIIPDGIIGYSIGELACAYADGCLTAEQAIISAYYCGRAFLETDLIPGTMMSIELGHKSTSSMIPSEIDIACHNCYNNCTISGPIEIIQEFSETLKTKNIYAEKVRVSNNIAFHSRYVSPVETKLLEYLDKVILEPKLRSKTWISSSVVGANWNLNNAKYCSPAYITNNLLNPVYFEETITHIPKNAITIEISPHSILQTDLNKSFGKNFVNVHLMKRDHEDNLDFFLHGLGKIFESGLHPQLEKLYPPVEFPVSRGTPMISPLIRWEHSKDWFIYRNDAFTEIKSGKKNFLITLKDDRLEYLSGHVVDGRNLYPATGYLVLVWETYALMRGKSYSEVSVVFENICLNRATNIPQEGSIDLLVMIQKGCGDFEVIESGEAVVTGRIYEPEDINKKCVNLAPIKDNNEDTEALPLNSDDIYKELRLRGYNYKGLFKGITYANPECTYGKLRWYNNFVTFMDTMLQMKISQTDSRGLFIPTSFSRIVINTKKHYDVLRTLDAQKPEFPVYVYKDVDMFSSGGIEIHHMRFSAISRKKPIKEPQLEKYQFTHFISDEHGKVNEIVRICAQIAVENLPTNRMKIIELIDSGTNVQNPFTSPSLVEALADFPLIQADVVVLASNKYHSLTDKLSEVAVENKNLPRDHSAWMIVASNVILREEILKDCLDSLKEGGFILARESTQERLPLTERGLEICSSQIVDNEKILLIRKSVAFQVEPIVVKISGDSFEWLPELQKGLASIDTANHQKLIFYAEKDKFSGILGLFTCLRKETNGECIRCYFIVDDAAPIFSIKDPFYKTQLMKDLSMNVYKNGAWGSYRHLLLENTEVVQTPYAYVNTLARGDMSTLRWIEGSMSVNLPKTPKYVDDGPGMLIAIYYASLNFRDTMLVTGKLASEMITRSRLDQETVLGLEFAGKSSDGRRWMGVEEGKAMATVIMGGNQLLLPVPDEWTLEEASTVPAVYTTVVYALILLGKIKKSEKVLIHAGTGGVGQAAINLCLYYKCEIFTTVGTPEKREFIRKHFPSIPESHIGNSRDTSFEQLVMRETNGKGVDVVLNSLAEEKLQASIRCLGHGGRFVEIGKFDFTKNNTLSMEHFSKGISFHGFLLGQCASASSDWRRKVSSLLETLIKKKAVKPLVRTVFEADKVEAAFRYMAAGKHIGKVVLKIRDEASPPNFSLRAIPRYYCQENTSVIICGGLGGFGIELADWLVLRGVRYLVLTSRKGVTSGYQTMRIRLWRSYGCKVVISTDDITKEEGARELLERANSLAPVSGIYNLTLVFQGALLENQTKEAFAAAYSPKARATRYLDKLSREMCPHLKQFVVFSSYSCGRGNQGQTDYGFSNSAMERICEMRKTDNLPALAIQWGTVADIGYTGDSTKGVIHVGGILHQSINSCMEVMDYFLKQQHPVVSSIVVDERQNKNISSEGIVGAVASILGLRDLRTINLHTTLPKLGMDSLMNVVIREGLERKFNVFLTLRDIRSLTFAKLHTIQLESKNLENKKGEVMKKQEKSSTGSLTTKLADSSKKLHLIQLISDEIQNSKPIVRIASLYENGSTIEVSVQHHPTVFILPGAPGSATTMEPLAKSLNLQVLCLQYPQNNSPVSIKELAKTLSSHISNRLNETREFYLIGFSFGGILSLEVVKLLEMEGRKGRLWLIDSYPIFSKTETKPTNGLPDSPEKLQNQIQLEVVNRFFDLFMPEANEKTRDDLKKIGNWNDRLDYILALVPPGITFNKSDPKKLLGSTYYRMLAHQEKEWNEELCLKAITTLIIPTEAVLPSSLDQGLSKLFTSPVDKKIVDGSHATILGNKKVAELIMAGMTLQNGTGHHNGVM